MREASSWSRVTDGAASSARDQLEAGLNEAAYCGRALWAFQLGRGAMGAGASELSGEVGVLGRLESWRRNGGHRAEMSNDSGL